MGVYGKKGKSGLRPKHKFFKDGVGYQSRAVCLRKQDAFQMA
jgi:hypothetical protein